MSVSQATSLGTVIDAARRLVDEVAGETRTLAVASFDLTSSVAMKVDLGHSVGTKSGLLHNRLCRLVSEAHGGQMIKELGDGVLCCFDDPIGACRAAVDVQRAVAEVGLVTKGSICLGIVELVQLDGTLDVLGTTVDRCARVLGSALPGQILLDRPIYDAAKSFLANMPELVTGPPLGVFLRGLGPTEVVELVGNAADLQGAVLTPLALHDEGPPAGEEIAAFVAAAQHDVVDLSVGLSGLAGGFADGDATDLSKVVGDLLRRGVSIRVATMDPDWQGTAFYLKDRQEFGEIEKMYDSLRRLKRQLGGLKDFNASGSFEVLLYRHVPTFHAICIDPKDADGARMLVTLHLYGLARDKAPALQFSRRTNPELFDAYWSSVRHILRDSTRG